ncbi:hypothetical protein AB9Q10_16175 [Streptomyces krungchingensis]|uniref:hypothetical protein n=1 Tax=Streptomyces krungchingensis TaxID=1565034 RepID=UPI003CF2C539
MAFPTELLTDGKPHLDAYAGPGRDGHVFREPQGGQLRRSNFRDDWIKAKNKAGITVDAHFQDSGTPGTPSPRPVRASGSL